MTDRVVFGLCAALGSGRSLCAQLVRVAIGVCVAVGLRVAVGLSVAVRVYVVPGLCVRPQVVVRVCVQHWSGWRLDSVLRSKSVCGAGQTECQSSSQLLPGLAAVCVGGILQRHL